MLIGEPSGEGDYWGSESPTPYRKRTMHTSEPLLHSPESSNRLVAACMLAALESGTEVDATERAVLRFMVERGFIKPDAPAHVEYGCLEHGVVHVSAWDDANRDMWFEIDPKSGKISSL